MKAVFGTVLLAPGGLESTSGFTLNGQQINDEVQFYGALEASRFARGNRSMVLGFNVLRLFATYRLAERFALEHFKLLPVQESLYLTIGAPSDSEVVRFDGVTPSNASTAKVEGTSVQVFYSFNTGLPIFDSPPPDLPEPDDTMIKHVYVDATNGADHQDVTFSSAFASTPVAGKPSVEIPGGGDFIEAWVVAGSVTTLGLSVKYNTAIPGTGYKLAIPVFA